MKNLGKSTGTMKKQDVYYKLDLRKEEIKWSKVVAFTGSLENKFKRDVEEVGSDKKLAKPYLKLGRVKKTLVLRIKDGSKHLGEWVVIEKFTPPSDLTGKDKEYAETLKKYGEDREQLLSDMTQLQKSVQKVTEVADKLVDSINDKAEKSLEQFRAGKVPEATKLLLEGRNEAAELTRMVDEMDRLDKLSVSLQEQQRGWNARKLGLDGPDYDEHIDEWWQSTRIGMEISVAKGNLDGVAREMTKLLVDTAEEVSGKGKPLEKALVELRTLFETIEKLRKDAGIWADHIGGHLRRFNDLAEQLPTLKSDEERQDLFDSEVPKRMTNADGYIARTDGGIKAMLRIGNRTKKLNAFVNTSTEGQKLTSDIVGEIRQAKENLLRAKSDRDKLDEAKATLEGLLELDS